MTLWCRNGVVEKKGFSARDCALLPTEIYTRVVQISASAVAEYLPIALLFYLLIELVQLVPDRNRECSIIT